MTAPPLLSVDGVSRIYRLPRRKLLAPRPMRAAIRDVSLTLTPGETLGIVGESGSGKSTLARMVMGFERPDAGRVRFDGQDLNALPRAALAALRPRFQMIFQDPFGSFDPRRPIGWSVAEPLLHDRALPPAHRHEKVAEMLGKVGLRASDAGRYPHEFSGGQRQRIAIARALITHPHLLVADEPVSALDVSIQAQILNLLMDMRENLGLTTLFISHDLGVVANFCDRVIVMHDGEIVERGATAEVLSHPVHPYTQSLLAACSPATKGSAT